MQKRKDAIPATSTHYVAGVKELRQLGPGTGSPISDLER